MSYIFQKEKFKSQILDEAGDIYFGNQLTQIQKSVYEFKYPPLKSFQLIPVDYNFNPAIKYIEAGGIQAVGRARIIDSYADDLPEAGVIGSSIVSKVRSLGDSYRYSRQDIREGQHAGFSLPNHLATAARMASAICIS